MDDKRVKEFVTFTSDIFSKERKKHHINRCCRCDDVATWIRDGISKVIPGSAVELYQEDFGWVVDVVPQNADYTIMIVSTNLDEKKTTNEFGVYVDTREPLLAGLFRKFTKRAGPQDDKNKVIAEIDRLLHNNKKIQSIQWWHEGFLVGEASERAA